jgi:hypothetical protein
MQPDGLLVALDGNRQAIWTAPQRQKAAGSSLTISQSGALQVVTPYGDITWSSNGNLVPELPIAAELPLSAGQMLEKNKTYRRRGNHPYTVRFGDNGDLVIAHFDGDVRWRLSDIFKGYAKGDSFRLEKDGTLAIRDKAGEVIWSAPPAVRNPQANLQLSWTGVLQLVESNQNILWSSTGILTNEVDVFAQATGTCPGKAPGVYNKCVTLTSPKITIMGSRLTSYSAMKGVAGVYQQMFDALRSAYPKKTFDGFTVYLTKGEPISEIKNWWPVGDAQPDISGENGADFLRGAANDDYLWLDEQMICKAGVVTRNDLARKQGTPLDNKARSFDQVVHEMAHSMERRYPSFKASNDIPFSDHPMERVEGLANGMQNWFGVGGELSERQYKHLADNVFTRRVAFRCDNYDPKPRLGAS